MSGVTRNDFAQAARVHLPAETADRWIALLRNGLRLRPTAAGEPVICRLGGSPRLPEATPWPEWPDRGPLTFIAEVECAALPRDELDSAFPADGTLLFFYFDGQLGHYTDLVTGSDEASQQGARVLYVQHGADTSERSAPNGIEPYPCQQLTGDIVVTKPDYGHPDALWTILEPGAATIFAPEFTHAVRALDRSPAHQIAGHAHPVQGAVEDELAPRAVPATTEPSTLVGEASARDWRLLAQFVSDGRSHMMWGDCGTLYWLITADDLAARRFDRARMTWQCH